MPRSSNFGLCKTFLVDVIKAFTVGATHTRVGLIKYSTNAETEFRLGQHNTGQKVSDHHSTEIS